MERKFYCIDCSKEGIYHIETTEYDYWLCEEHMKIAWKHTEKMNELRMMQQ